MVTLMVRSLRSALVPWSWWSRKVGKQVESVAYVFVQEPYCLRNHSLITRWWIVRYAFISSGSFAASTNWHCRREPDQLTQASRSIDPPQSTHDMAIRSVFRHARKAECPDSARLRDSKTWLNRTTICCHGPEPQRCSGHSVGPRKQDTAIRSHRAGVESVHSASTNLLS